MKQLHLSISFLICFLGSLSVMQAQDFFFPVPDQDYCTGSGEIVEVVANYTNLTSSVITDFELLSSDINLSVAAPALNSGSASFPALSTSGSGVQYEFKVTSIHMQPHYIVELKILSGITTALSGTVYTIRANLAGGGSVSSNPIELTVANPITVSVTTPGAPLLTVCENQALTLSVSTSSVPDTYIWYKDGASVAMGSGAVADYTVPMSAAADAGAYSVEVIDAGCPDQEESVSSVIVVPSVSLVETDMSDKELPVGDTQFFSVTASNVDLNTTYTWTVDGNPYEADDLPATIGVNGNDIEINHITNTTSMAGSTTTAVSEISISNISAPGAPSYMANVQVTVSNNAVCEAASVGAVMSSVTTIFPVEWSYFTAKREHENVRLEWETATESNNKEFVIERSVNGRDYEVLATVAGAGTSQYATHYSWNDNKALTQDAYYRLLQRDFDGTESYSAIRIVKADKTSTELGAVVLNAHQASVDLHSLVDDNTTLELFDIRGALVHKQAVAVQAGTQTLQFDLPATRGVYLIRMHIDGQQLTQRFVR